MATLALHCMLQTEKYILHTTPCTLYTASHALHIPHCTLYWSQIVFMETLALLTIARYSQKLDRRDVDQMTLGGNRI